MRRKQDVLDDAGVTLSVCPHSGHPLETQMQQHSGEEEGKGVKEEEEEGEWEEQKDGEEEELIFLYPHRQLHHHANDSLSTRCKVEAL